MEISFFTFNGKRYLCFQKYRVCCGERFHSFSIGYFVQPAITSHYLGEAEFIECSAIFLLLRLYGVSLNIVGSQPMAISVFKGSYEFPI